MHIKSVYLKNFKRFSELKLNFPADLTVVKGPNERGKSTLVQAFLVGLFKDPTKSPTTKYIDSFRSWENKEKLYEINLEFEASGEEYQLLKDFEQKKLELINSSTGRIWKTNNEILDLLFRLGGYRTPELFEATACIKQDALSEISSRKQELNQALEDLVTSGQNNVSASDILKRIGKKLQEMTKGLDGRLVKAPGVLKELETRLEEKNRILEDLRGKIEETESLKANLKNLKKKYQKQEKELKIALGELQQNEVYFKAKEELSHFEKELEKITQDLESLKEIIQKKKEVESVLKDFPGGFKKHDLDKAMQEVLKVSQEIEIKKREGEKRQQEVKLFKAPSSKINFKILLGLGLASCFVGISGLFLGFWLCFFFVPAALLLWISLKILIQRFIRPVSLVSLEKEIKKSREEIAGLGKRLKKKLEIFGCENVSSFQKKCKEYKTLLGEFEKLGAREEGVLRGKSFDELKQEERGIIKRLAILEEKIIPEQKVSPPTSRGQGKLKLEVETLTKSQEGLKDKIRKSEITISQGKVDKETIIVLEEEVINLKEILEGVQNKRKIYELAENVLKEARNSAIKSSRDSLENSTGGFISQITSGKYEKIKIKDDLTFEVFSPEKKEWLLPQESLSKGTIDQLYLVARFSFVKLLSAGAERPLIVLDDPIVSFDKTRKGNAKKLCQELSKDFQIILLTHTDDYDSWGKTVTI